MRHALIEGTRIAQVEDEPFPVSEPLYWIEVPDDTLAESTFIDGEITPPTLVVMPGESPSRTYKSAMFRRMTDEEFALYEQIRAGFPPRLAALFDAVEYLSSDDEFWPPLVDAANQAYGEERAAEILAP